MPGIPLIVSSVMVLFPLVCFLPLETAGGQLCMKCNAVVDPGACATVTRCSDHEQCSILQYVLPGGGPPLYDIGCTENQQCHATTGKREVFRDGRVITCKECCNSSKICNIGGLCGTQRFDAHGGHICFKCDQMLTPDTCSQLTLCSHDQRCYIGQKIVGLSGITVYESKCVNPILECNGKTGINSVLGKRSSGKCSACCNTDFCNDRCNVAPVTPDIQTAIAPTTTTEVKTTTRPFVPAKVTNIGGINSVRVGTAVRLFCSVSGYPTPTVGWNVLVRYPNTNNFHMEGNGHILVIENYQRKNNGKYQCFTSNTAGQDSRIVTLQA